MRVAYPEVEQLGSSWCAMDSFSSYLKKAEEMLQAVDDSVAKHMKNEGSIGPLAFSLSGVAEEQRPHGREIGERPTTAVEIKDSRSRTRPEEGLGDDEITNTQGPALVAGGSISSTHVVQDPSSASAKLELINKKKRLEERRLELKEKKKKERQRQGKSAASPLMHRNTAESNDSMTENRVDGEKEKLIQDHEPERKKPEPEPERNAERKTEEEEQARQHFTAKGREKPQLRQPELRESTHVENEQEVDADRLIRLVEALRKKNKGLDKEVLHLEDELTRVETKNREFEESIAKLQAMLQSTQSEAKKSDDRAESLHRELQEASSLINSQEETIRELRQAIERKEQESATMTAERNVSETQLLASLRKDVDAAEMLAESERRAHAQSRKTFEARETQLEESVARAAAALADSQAQVDEYVGKLAESQARCTELEVRLLEAKQSASSVPSNSHTLPSVDDARVQELEQELSSALKDAANAKNELSTWKHDVNRVKNENESLKQQIVKLESTDATSLQRRLNELTSALYSKQAQIENLSAEKNALMMQSQADVVRRRSAAVDKLFSGTDESDVVPMRSLRAVDRLAGWKAAEQWVEKLARLLDAIAMQAVALIRLSPVFRLAFFSYLLGMHLFIYVMLYSWGTSTHSPRSRPE